MRDDTAKHTAHFVLLHWASCQTVSNRLNHARAYFYWALPTDNLSTGKDTHCVWEESPRNVAQSAGHSFCGP